MRGERREERGEGKKSRIGQCCSHINTFSHTLHSMGAIKSLIEAQLPGVFVYSIEIGDSPSKDTENGFLMNVNEQVRKKSQQLQQPTTHTPLNSFSLSVSLSLSPHSAF
jgi:hypothetical protein